jgi:putative addiction module component (TIGR02574 family)
MSRVATDLLKKALGLSVSERAELAGSLIESLDTAEDESVEAAWEAETARRMADIDSGRSKTITLAEARRKLSSAAE